MPNRRRLKTLKNSDSKEKALKAANTAVDKKAADTVILELTDLSTIADYFIICTGENPAQIKAISEAIKEGFQKKNILPIGIEGLKFVRWVLMDYGDIIVHIFSREARNFYELERFWIDAPRIPLEEKKKISRRPRIVK
ncbi:MAG: ribosome silencing factor [Nitrospirae bacterium]|nr:ribosome silencing factor [Nitrospirota bacterium]